MRLAATPTLAAFGLALSLPLGAQSRVNLATYQATSGSNANSTYATDYAVDGIVSNFNAFRTAGTSTPQWLEIDFPRLVPIGSAHLYLGIDGNASLGLASFSLQRQVNGTWTDIPGTVVSGNTAAEVVLNLPAPVLVDSIRVRTTQSGVRAIREVALFPPNLVGGVEQGYPLGTDVRQSLAHRRPAVASSIYNGGFPKLAFDGYVDDTSRWLSTSTAADETLEVDLLSPHVVASAHLHSGFTTGAAMPEGILEYHDGTTWRAIPGASFTGNTSQSLAIPFTSTVTTTRLRLRGTAAGFSRVRELLVFPPRAGGFALGTDVIVGPPPTAKWEDFSDSKWRLRNGAVDLRLALVGGSPVLGRASDGIDAIEWQLLLNYRDGSYRVRHVATGKCLALAELSREPGTLLVAENYSALPHQDWWVERISTSAIRLVNVYSGMAVAPSGGSLAYGTALVAATPSSGTLQQWQHISPILHPKKGLGATGANFASFHERFPSSWSYTWGRQRQATFVVPVSHSYNPMQWGNFNWSHGSNQGPFDVLQNDMVSSPKPIHLMGFNEPDKEEQANMTVDQVVALWPRLEAMGMPLVAPVPASLSPWLDQYVAKADALGYRRDFTAVHWYGSPNSDSLVSSLQAAYNTYDRPVWLTEFSPVRWSGTATWTHADNFNFLAEFLWRAESLPWLKRYALFHFSDSADPNPLDTAQAPRGNSLKVDGTRTPYGDLYAGWDGVAAVVNEKAYHLHNRGAYRRARNPGSAGPGSVVPGDAADGQQWFLVPGTTANTVRILSTKDARPLAFTDADGLAFAAAGTTTLATEWRLETWQHGWYYIAHPATSKRLRLTTGGTWSLVSGTSTGETDRWRLVVPVVPERLGPPHANAIASAWLEAALAAFPAGERLGTADPDRDGLANLLEFVFLADPAARGASPIAVSAATAGSVTLAFPWNWRAEGVRWQVRRGQSLTDRASWPVVSPSSQSATRDGDVDRLSVTIPLDGPTGGFVVLEVIED